MKKLGILGLLLLAGSLLAGCGTGNLDQGQVKYTPGVPPWQEKDPAKRGPGTRGPETKAPAADAAGQSSNQPPPGGGPPGMTAPDRG